jgi:hypothetical protein
MLEAMAIRSVIFANAHTLAAPHMLDCIAPIRQTAVVAVARGIGGLHLSYVPLDYADFYSGQLCNRAPEHLAGYGVSIHIRLNRGFAEFVSLKLAGGLVVEIYLLSGRTHALLSYVVRAER